MSLTETEQKQNLEAFDKLQEKKKRLTIKELRQRQLEKAPLTAKDLKRLEKWKWSPEGILASAREHLGNILNNTTGTGLKDLAEAILLGALAYQSYIVLNGKDNGWTTALYGPLAFKLATAQTGTPPVSQAAGLAMLATIGVASTPNLTLAGLFKQAQGQIGTAEQQLKDAYNAILSVFSGLGGSF